MLAFRDHERVTLRKRIDVEEGEVIIILPHFVTRD
jgi:hypothetical protein